MWKDLIVAIFAATDARDPTTGVFGTGYPVTEDLILTSRHVVVPENQNIPGRIEVKWFYDAQPRWIEADVVWTGQGDLDAALIRCRRPESLQRFTVGRLVERRPVEGEPWQSAGFARANKRGDVREPGQFGGTLRSMAEGASFFEVVEDAQPIAEEQWKGVSGMPVFVRAELLGVVKHVPPNFDCKKLEAVPAWRLLRDEGFRKALGIDEQRERLESARKLLDCLLAKSEKATRDLATALKREFSGGDLLKCRERVVEALLTETPALERLFELACSVQEKRRAEQDRAGARVAANLLLTILPALHDAAAVSEVRRCKGNGSVGILALPTKLKTLAEIIMAGADRRAARLRPPATRLVFPEGEACLPEPPESGRDADGQQFARDWRTHLLETFDTDLDRFKNAFQEYLKERFIPSDLRSASAGIAEQELLDTVVAQLRQEAGVRDGGLTYYFIARMPENPEARRQREDLLAELKQAFPPIAFLRLAGAEPLNVEWERYGKLRDLLYEDPEANR